MSFRPLDVIVAVILVLGGLNFGLMGFFDINVITRVLGNALTVERVIYAVIGLAALYQIIEFKAIQHRWNCHT